MKKLSQEQILEMVELIQQGYTYTFLADRFNVSASTISYSVPKEHRKGRGGNQVKSMVNEALELYRAGALWEDIQKVVKSTNWLEKVTQHDVETRISNGGKVQKSFYNKLFFREPELKKENQIKYLSLIDTAISKWRTGT